ncbi:hypothetical protein HWV62_10539 [Athelia sp. TMB]|nr:hypothetical protein HWV62_10539 [Athelia sp. TMB]
MSGLPTPASSKQRRVFRRSNIPVSQTRALDILFARARVTNLGFLALAIFAILSFIYNLSYHFSYAQGQWGVRPESIFQTLPHFAKNLGLDHLIIVPGHSIWTGTDPSLKLDEDQWLLEPYQKGGGRIDAFVSHIARGGQTRAGSTTTEAESYLRLATSSGLLPPSPSTHFRATTEDHALDSYQNLLFSIARFHEVTGKWPTHITVVGYEMKRRRFEELHREALRWPTSRFDYVGIDAEKDGKTAQAGELANGYKPYTQDLYGCHSTLLAKRRSRNIFWRFHSYYTSSPELAHLMNWCPDTQTDLFRGPLPWDILTKDS